MEPQANKSALRLATDLTTDLNLNSAHNIPAKFRATFPHAFPIAPSHDVNIFPALAEKPTYSPVGDWTLIVQATLQRRSRGAGTPDFDSMLTANIAAVNKAIILYFITFHGI